MPQETGYAQQSGPARPVALPDASPAAFGAGVGAAVEDLGQTLHEAKLRSYQLDRQQKADSEAADFAARFARAREAADKASIDARANAAPGGAGHAEAMAGWWQTQQAALTDGITDDHVRARAAEQLSEFGGRFRSAEYQWQEGTRVGKLVTDIGTATDLAANRARRSHDSKSFAEELAHGRQSIEAMAGVPVDVRDKLIREHDEKVTVGYFNGLIDTNPAVVPRLLDSGGFDGILTPEQAERLRDGAHVEMDRDKVAAERAQRQTEAQVASQADVAMQDHTAGVQVDPGTLRTEASRVRATDPERAARFDRAAAGAEETARYGGGNADPGQITARIATLTGAKGWESKPDTVARVQSLEKLRDQVRSAEPEFTPLNFDDPGAIRQRAVDVAGWQRTHNGARAVLGRDQALEMARQAQSGPNGRLQVAEALSRLPGQLGTMALDQVAPKDGVLRHALDLPHRLRMEVFRGEERLATNPTLTPMQDIRDRWTEHGEPAFDGLPDDYAAATFDTARMLYAARSKGPDFDKKLWDAALDQATGRGGLGKHKGVAIVLPTGMSQDDLDARWANLPDLPVAHHENGSRISGAELRNRYHLVNAPYDGQYYLADTRGQFVVAANHQRVRLNIRAVPLPGPRRAEPQTPVRPAVVPLPTDPNSPYAKMGLGGAGR